MKGLVLSLKACRRHRVLGHLAGLVLYAVFSAIPLAADGSKAQWSQWLGPYRDGVSPETDLLKDWPDTGPPQVWKVEGGEGFSGISAAGDRLYTMYVSVGQEYVVALAADTGKEIWRYRSGEIFNDTMGGNGPRSTPTVAAGRVYALGAHGRLCALEAQTGKEIWQRDLKGEFGARVPQWGLCASPIIEGDLVLIEAGGDQGKAIVAFNKTSGELAWTSQSDKPGYSSPIAAEINGKRQIIFFTGLGLVALNPVDGNPYWKYPWKTDYDVNAATPVFVAPDRLFVSSGYGTGATLVQVTAGAQGMKAQEVWKSKVMKNHWATSVLYQGHLYGFDDGTLKCIEAESGQMKWRQRGFAKGSLIVADGHLIILGEQGKLALAEATPKAYSEKSSFQALKGKCWTVPTLNGGRLYLRNEKEILCLNLRGTS